MTSPISILVKPHTFNSLQDFAFSEEFSFVTAPPPGSDATVKLLAIADLGFCEEDGSMTWPGNYPNAVAVEPYGTDVQIISEVTHGKQTLPVHMHLLH